MNKIVLLLSGFLFVFMSCNENPTKGDQREADTQSDTVKELFGGKQQAGSVEQERREKAKKEAVPVHTLKPGETLWELCREKYGNRHYSDILAAYNGIEDVSQLKQGTEIEMPDLWRMLTGERLGLDTINAEIESVIKARAIFMRHEKKLYEWRSDSTQDELPAVVKADLEKASAAVDIAIESLEAKEHPPRKMIGQLESVSANLENLSEGHHDGPYGYDLDMVHQRLVHAFKNGMAWAESGYR